MPSSLAIPVASGMKLERKRRGGGLEQAEMAEMVCHWRWSLVMFQFACLATVARKEGANTRMSGNYPTKITSETTDATPSKIPPFCNFPPSFKPSILRPRSHSNRSFSKSSGTLKELGSIVIRLVYGPDLADAGDPGYLRLARVRDLLLASLREEEINLVVVTDWAVDALLEQHWAHKICLCTPVKHTGPNSRTNTVSLETK